MATRCPEHREIDAGALAAAPFRSLRRRRAAAAGDDERARTLVERREIERRLLSSATKPSRVEQRQE